MAWAGPWTSEQGHSILIIVLSGLEHVFPGNENGALNVKSMPTAVLRGFCQSFHLIPTTMADAYHTRSWLYQMVSKVPSKLQALRLVPTVIPTLPLGHPSQLCCGLCCRSLSRGNCPTTCSWFLLTSIKPHYNKS